MYYAKVNRKRKPRRLHSSIKLCIIDENKEFRKSLKTNLEKDRRILVTSNEESGLSVLKKCNSTFKADVCLINAELEDISGIEFAKEIVKKKPNIHIILMTSNPTSAMFAEARKIGADYIEKGPLIRSLLKNLLSSIEQNGKKSIYPTNTEEPVEIEYLDMAHDLYTAKQRMLDLSVSQVQVLRMRKEGKSLNEIAEILGVAPGTVHTHISRALKKLQLPDVLRYVVD